MNESSSEFSGRTNGTQLRARARYWMVKGTSNWSPREVSVYWYVPITRPPTAIESVTGVCTELHMS